MISAEEARVRSDEARLAREERSRLHAEEESQRLLEVRETGPYKALEARMDSAIAEAMSLAHYTASVLLANIERPLLPSLLAALRDAGHWINLHDTPSFKLVVSWDPQLTRSGPQW